MSSMPDFITFVHAGELALAWSYKQYATSIHMAMGSKFVAVALSAALQHFVLLERHLLQPGS